MAQKQKSGSGGRKAGTKKPTEKETVEKSERVQRPDRLRSEIIKPSRSAIVSKQAAVASRARDVEDKGWGSVDGVVEPHYDPGDLALIPENSNILPQCIDAVAVNVDSFGHTFKLRDPRLKATDDNKIKDEIEKERQMLKEFFEWAAYPASFIDLRLALRTDKGATGNAFWEMLDVRGELAGINHLPAHTMRLIKKETQPTVYKPPIISVDDKGIPKIIEKPSLRRFRKFVQLTEKGDKIYFKEWGDPRMMSWKTGEYKDDLPEPERATSVLHFKRYSSRTPYGVPNWIGNIFSVLGSRSAEEINFNSFTSNMVPSMALLVSGGQVTQGTIDRIREYLEDVVAGSSNYSEILLIEAEGPDDMIHTQGTIRIELKPLTDVQRSDEMFVNYDKNNRGKIRQSFRFSSIFLGNDEGFNRATSQVARRLGEEQVFRPERQSFDWIISNLILPYLKAKYHRYESRGPVVTDPEIMARSLAAAEKGGGLTPRITRETLEDILGRDLPDVDSNKVDPDKPMSLQVAEAAKTQSSEGADGAVKTPTVKSLDALSFMTNILDLRDAIKGGVNDLGLDEARDFFDQSCGHE